MTQQMTILTTMMSYFDNRGKVSINPYYGANIYDVVENIDRAKMFYQKVFRTFLTYALISDKDTFFKVPISWSTLEILEDKSDFWSWE